MRVKEKLNEREEERRCMLGDICVMRLLEIGSCRQRQINYKWKE